MTRGTVILQVKWWDQKVIYSSNKMYKPVWDFKPVNWIYSCFCFYILIWMKESFSNQFTEKKLMWDMEIISKVVCSVLAWQW